MSEKRRKPFGKEKHNFVCTVAFLKILCDTVYIEEAEIYLDVDFPLIQGQITIIDILYSCIYNRNKALSSMKFNKTTHAVRDDKIL